MIDIHDFPVKLLANNCPTILKQYASYGQSKPLISMLGNEIRVNLCYERLKKDLANKITRKMTFLLLLLFF